MFLPIQKAGFLSIQIVQVITLLQDKTFEAMKATFCCSFNKAMISINLVLFVLEK